MGTAAARLIVRYTVGRDTENSSPRSVIIRVPLTAPERQRYASAGERVADVASIGHRSFQSIQLGDDECVACSNRGEGLVEPRPFAFRAAHAVIDADAVRGNAEREERLALSGEVVFVG